jgi:uncharacterized membrane protein
MSSVNDSWMLISDPAYPRSLFGLEVPPALVLPGLAVVGIALVVLTVWTYLGVRGATPQRVLIVLGLRLVALLAAILAVMRPSLASRNELQTPSLLIIAVDSSESMAIDDELNRKSRWDYVQRTLRECEPTLKELYERHNITVAFHRFAGDVLPVVPEGQSDLQRASTADLLRALAQMKPDGKRSDYGLMLHELLDGYRTERFLRGLVVIGDGTDNGTHIRHEPLALAAEWRNLPCPIDTFAVGDPKTSDLERVALRAVDPDSLIVPMKGDLTIKAVVDAPGFVGTKFQPRLFIDGAEVSPNKVFLDEKEIKGEDPKFRRANGNEVKLVCTAPAKPGEVKVTVRIDGPGNEGAKPGREMSTYMTITKEGFSVLFVDRARFSEPQLIIDHLAKEKRINLHRVWFRKDEEAAVSQTDLFKFEDQKYDVIVFGDVTPRQIRSGNPAAFATIKDLVEKGAGVVFLGGNQFGRAGWNKVDELKELLPVTADVVNRINGQVRMKPANDDAGGPDRFMLRLDDNPVANLAHWKKLRALNGMPSLGRVKSQNEFQSGGAPVVLAESDKGDPMLVWKQYGKGRVLVFAGDTTTNWINDLDNEDGIRDFERFWQRTVLWLARQEDSESNIKVDLPSRRLPSGEGFDFGVALTNKGGADVKNASFTATLINPGGAEKPLTTGRGKDGAHGAVEKDAVAVPGEYRIRVSAKGQDADGNEVKGDPREVRFIVYQDETETTVRAANHDFLKKLAADGGGHFHQTDELPAFLKHLAAQPLPQGRPRANLWPDWRNSQLSGFLVGFFFVFVALLSLEWFLRRRWGLV